MNKEFIGKKKFYLEDNPDVFVIARIYVVETRQNEYFTAVLENGDSYQIELVNGPCDELSEVKSFIDFDNRLFLEYPTRTIKDLSFFDRKNNNIGKGELSIIELGSQRIYVGDIVPNRSFKYKKNGWDFEAAAGVRIGGPMIKVDFLSSKELFENKFFQIKCYLPTE